MVDPQLGILDSFPLMMRHNGEMPGLVHLYVSFAAEAAAPGYSARSFFLDRFDRFREAFFTEIREKQADGAMKESLAARELHALADGLQTQWLLDLSFDMASRIIDTINGCRTGS